MTKLSLSFIARAYDNNMLAGLLFELQATVVLKIGG
jgi:hypothetical protein